MCISIAENACFVLAHYTLTQQGLDLQLVQETSDEATHLCGCIVLRNPTNSVIGWRVGATQHSLYTSKQKWGSIGASSEMRVKLRIAMDSIEREMELDDLITALDSASSHTFVIQTATLEPTAKRGHYVGDDLRQQEIRGSTQTVARLSRIAGMFDSCLVSPSLSETAVAQVYATQPYRPVIECNNGLDATIVL
jgi:hypothetical protein